MRFDVQIQAPSSLRVENNLAHIVASADLVLRGTYDRPHPDGRVRVERGEAILEGKRYVVRRGNVDFINPTKIEPLLDLEAETLIRVPGQTYVVNIQVAGTFDRLKPAVHVGPAALGPRDRCRCSSAATRRAPRPRRRAAHAPA